MKQKLALWISQKRILPYRLRKSIIKRTCPKILTDHAFEINFYGMKYVGNTKDSTDRLFFMFGGCEKYMLSFLRDYYKATGQVDFVFFDVGAHVGNHAMFMSKYASEVHAFEPNPAMRESMSGKIYQNNISNITVHPIGLSDRNERIPFYVSQVDHLSVGSFRKDHDERNSYFRDLDVRVGDEVVRDKKIQRVDAIKIDVEGFEREVIEGLKNTIETWRPLIIAEISATTRSRFGSRDDFESIFPKDYCFYQFSGVSRERSGYKLAPFDFDAHTNHLDVIVVPAEKRGFLGDKVTTILRRNKVVGGDE